MKTSLCCALAVLLLLAGCQSNRSEVHILDGEQLVSLSTRERVPAALLAQAGVELEQADRLLYLGLSVPLDVALPEAPAYTLLVRRAVPIRITDPSGTRQLLSSAQTVGEALREAGHTPGRADRVMPPLETPLTAGLQIELQPSRRLSIHVDGQQLAVQSSAATVGLALAEAGLPLQGLDYSLPAETQDLPADGIIRIVRVVEPFSLALKSIPFETRTELSAELEIDQQALLQGGEPGLAVARTRSRLEDGQQVAQQVEDETLVRPAQDRILGIGTRIVIRTAVVDGVTIEYWRVLNLKVTSYSPCRSLSPDGRCLYGTSLGTLVRRGEVAMVYSWWLLLAHERIFVPGYGEAIVEDVGGGWPLGNHYWVDLGWGEDEYQPLMYADGVPVYFLTPVPANVSDMYIMP